MADDFGLSFSPTTTTDPRKAQADPNAPVQEAVRTLSLRLPRVVGARGAAPQPLLNGLALGRWPRHGRAWRGRVGRPSALSSC